MAVFLGQNGRFAFLADPVGHTRLLRGYLAHINQAPGADPFHAGLPHIIPSQGIIFPLSFGL